MLECLNDGGKKMSISNLNLNELTILNIILIQWLEEHEYDSNLYPHQDFVDRARKLQEEIDNKIK